MLLTTPLFAYKAREGEKLYQEKKYGEAAEKFLEAEVEDLKIFSILTTKGVSQYKAGDYEKAAEAFQNLLVLKIQIQRRNLCTT